MISNYLCQTYLAENMDPFSNSARSDDPDDYCFWLRLCERGTDRSGAVHVIKKLGKLHLCVSIQNNNILTSVTLTYFSPSAYGASVLLSITTGTKSKNIVSGLCPFT